MSPHIYGLQPVRELLRRRPDSIEQILISREESHSEEILNLARQKGVKIVPLPRPELDRLTGTREHQGVAAAAPLPEVFAIEDVLERAEGKSDSLLIFLDQLEDPQNLGAIIRSAECAGADGVVIPEHKSARISPAVMKASAGALEWIPVAVVTNLARALDLAKKAGYWIYAARMDAKSTIWKTEFSPQSALIIGSEGKGIRPLVEKSADFELGIPMFGNLSSLNASASAAIVIYEYRRQRAMARKG